MHFVLNGEIFLLPQVCPSGLNEQTKADGKRTAPALKTVPYRHGSTPRTTSVIVFSFLPRK